MAKSISAHDVEVILARWALCELTAAEVHNWAEARYATDGWAPENGAINEVLSHLDQLDMNLVVVDDIPLLRQALLAHNEEDANRMIERTYAISPIAARKLRCAGDPFYEPFCN